MTLTAGRRLNAALAAVALALVLLVAARPAPAAADTCLGVLPCPPGASQVAGAATDLIPGLGAASTVIGTVAGSVGSAAASIASGLLDQIGAGIASAVQSLFTQLSGFLTASTTPQVNVASFTGSGGPYHQVAALAAVAMVGFMFLTVIGGALAGDLTTAAARMLRNVPLAVLAIAGFPWAVDQLVSLVDALCAALLPTGPTLTTIAQVYAADQVRAAVGFGLPAILTELFVFLGGMAIYAELVVRAALVTVVVALAPLSFAAMVWPAARGAARKAVELVCAIVLSKLAIWVALDVGIALYQTHTQAAPSGQAWGQMISGAAVIGVAVFAPFVVWRLLPVAEAAIVAQGLSRMPGRAALNTAQTATNMSRRAGAHTGGGSRDELHPALDLPARSLAEPAAGDGAAAAGTRGAAAASTGGPAAAAGGVAPVAGPVAAAVEAAKTAKEHLVTSADQHADTATPAAGGWSFRPADPDGGRP